MKKHIRRASAAALLALSALVAAALATASCSVGMNEDVLDAVNPKKTDKPEIEIYSGAAVITDDANAAVSLTDIYDLGYAEKAFSRTFTITNSGKDDMVVYMVASDQPAAIAVSAAPDANTRLAPKATATFTLTVADPSVATEGSVTINTSDADGHALVVKLYGGGPLIALTMKDAFPYRLDGNGYDIGYVDPAAAAAARTLTFTNSGKIPVTFATTPVAAFTADTNGAPTVTASTAFAVSAQVSTPTLAVGAEATLGVSFDSVASTWSESVVTLKDKFGRSFRVNLTGSGFKQPSNVATTPALWLRADRIKREDTLVIDSVPRLTTWSDSSNNGLSANAVSLNSVMLRPVYNSNGINGMPSITFSGNANTDHLKVYKEGGFLNTSTGETVFIAFKTGLSIDSSRYILRAYNPDDVTEVFPRLMWEQRNIDIEDGFFSNGLGKPISVYPLGVYGYGSSVNRHLFDTNWENPTVRPMENYVVTMKYDLINLSTNLFTWLNGHQRNIGYIHSNSANTVNTAAWGLPVGNGDGTRNTLANDKDNDYSRSLGSTHAYYYNRVYPTYNNIVARLHIGASTNSQSNFKGEIAEILIYPKPLTPEEIVLINTYLTTKYAAN